MGQDSKVVADGADDLEVLRKIEFPELNKEQFADLCAWANLKKLDIRAGHVCAKLEPLGGGRYRIVPMVKINGLCARAQATGLCGDIPSPIWEYEGEGLICARATVHRVSGEASRKIEGVAHWDNFYPGPDAFWEKMPEHMLAKCALAIALRMAFPEVLGNLYCPEEASAVAASRSAQSKPNLIQRDDGRILDVSDAQ